MQSALRTTLIDLKLVHWHFIAVTGYTLLTANSVLSPWNACLRLCNLRPPTLQDGGVDGENPEKSFFSSEINHSSKVVLNLSLRALGTVPIELYIGFGFLKSIVIILR